MIGEKISACINAAHAVARGIAKRAPGVKICSRLANDQFVFRRRWLLGLT
jgi:hypothetical protein